MKTICCLLLIHAGCLLTARLPARAAEQPSTSRAGNDWWSWQPIVRPRIPALPHGWIVDNPIDALVHHRLKANRLTMAPRAARRTLVRRAHYDLLGLPPTPEESEAFLADTSPDAYRRLIDRLLASPHYGERWGRYWLDVVRFAETCGYERDQLKPNLWRYRDWVIAALNDDMPYDQFVMEQLAGDEVAWRDRQSVIATGMLRAGTWNDEPNDPADYVYERLEDMVHTTSTAFLGLTVKCARCHDHKFDPISQRDYYRVASLFWAGYIGQENLGGPNKDQLGYDVFAWTDRGRTADPLRLLIQGDRHRPGPVVEPGFLSALGDLGRDFAQPPRESATTRRRLQFAGWITDRRHPLTARVIVNRLWQHHFGTAIVRTPDNFGAKGDSPTHPQLLDWLALELIDGGWRLKRMHRQIMLSQTYQQASIHPLQALYAQRDSANRLYWRQNRRRLDAEAVRDSMLAVSGQLNRELGGPSFYPRMSKEALEGLSRKASAWGESPPRDCCRRSVYMMTKRSRLLPLMTTFDFGDTTLPCGQREVTTVPTQALALLNNQFVHEQSEAMARRLVAESGQQLSSQITRAWQLAFGRRPTADEAAAATTHCRRQRKHFLNRPAKGSASISSSPNQLALASLCHVLLNTNELLYVD